MYRVIITLTPGFNTQDTAEDYVKMLNRVLNKSKGGKQLLRCAVVIQAREA